MKTGFRFFAACLAGLGCHTATAGTGLQPGTASLSARKTVTPSRGIVGVWRVARFCIPDSLGRQHDPLGTANGYFIYTAAGYVSLQFGRAPGVIPAPAESLARLRFSADERRGFEAGHVAYFGRYTVESDSVLIHHVEGGSLPSYVGTEQRRRYRIYGAAHDTLAIGDTRLGCRVLIRVE